MPQDDFVRGGASAVVRTVAGGLATQIDYSYDHADGPQSGMLLLQVAQDRASAVFLDTFHQFPAWLMLIGTAHANGLEVKANYAPGFEWIIAVTWASADSWRLLMSNAMAEVGSYLAVEMDFRR